MTNTCVSVDTNAKNPLSVDTDEKSPSQKDMRLFLNEEKDVSRSGTAEVEFSSASTVNVDLEDAGNDVVLRRIVQSRLHSDISPIDILDSGIYALCDDPGIFTVVWISRDLTPTFFVLLIISILLQVFLPAYIALQIRPGEFEAQYSEDTITIKIAYFILTLYLASTLVATLERSRIMCFMAPKGDDRKWPLFAGMITICLSVVGTVIATIVLFIENTTVEDMLLNCIALNFLPDVDVAMVKLLRMGDAGHLIAAKSKLSKYAEAWERSDERKEMTMLLNDQFSSDSLMIKLFAVGDRVMLFLILVAAIAGTVIA